MTRCGYGMTRCGYGIIAIKRVDRIKISKISTLCGYGMTRCGYGMTRCGYGMTRCGYGKALKIKTKNKKIFRKKIYFLKSKNNWCECLKWKISFIVKVKL